MATYTQVFHTGTKWIEVTYEPILDDKGNLTGHNREISRRQITVFGIFDDKKVLDEAIANIDAFRTVMRQDIYRLDGFKDEMILYKSYSYGADSLANNVIQYLKDRNLVVVSYDKYDVDKGQDVTETIVFKCYERELEGEADCKIYTITLSCWDRYLVGVM
jgi:hypothetical protein